MYGSIDCGEGPALSLGSLPKMCRALGVWMVHFDRAKETPIGPVEATIKLTPGLFAEVSLTLAIDGIKAHASWQVDFEWEYSARKLARKVLADAERARMRLSFRLFTERGYV